ncbi:uncharacterized protein LOC127393808 isoform X2 [Apus apus]|uniref:uncharacterized protein LOC127393808 isoform X2 n=1 Tax=Apus apus TaxID=8895 RepID=UPI0021F830A4|nr:uncharacterized protein LOC127393808 isoform X2 [Apus apus]
MEAAVAAGQAGEGAPRSAPPPPGRDRPPPAHPRGDGGGGVPFVVAAGLRFWVPLCPPLCLPVPLSSGTAVGVFFFPPPGSPGRGSSDPDRGGFSLHPLLCFVGFFCRGPPKMCGRIGRHQGLTEPHPPEPAHREPEQATPNKTLGIIRACIYFPVLITPAATGWKDGERGTERSEQGIGQRKRAIIMLPILHSPIAQESAEDQECFPWLLSQETWKKDKVQEHKPTREEVARSYKREDQ